MERAEFSVGIGFPCGENIGWRTTMSLARTVHAAALMGVPLNIHAVAGRSEERRVWKECRSRWSPYH